MSAIVFREPAGHVEKVILCGARTLLPVMSMMARRARRRGSYGHFVLTPDIAERVRREWAELRVIVPLGGLKLSDALFDGYGAVVEKE